MRKKIKCLKGHKSLRMLCNGPETSENLKAWGTDGPTDQGLGARDAYASKN